MAHAEMLIRAAKLSDTLDILSLSKEQMKRYPLRPDAGKIKALIVEAISSPRHYVWVLDAGGITKGVLAGLTADNLWAQRQNCNISIWVSEVPGGGAELLRHFKSWVLSRRAIKVAGMCPDIEIDPRALKLAERIGFTRHGGAYLLYN